MALFISTYLSLVAVIAASIFLQLSSSAPSPAPDPQILEFLNRLFRVPLEDQCPALPKGGDFRKRDPTLVLNKILYADGTARYDCISGAIRGAPSLGRARTPAFSRKLIARGQISPLPAILEANLVQWSRPEHRDTHSHGIRPGSPSAEWGRITETMAKDGFVATLEHSSGHSLRLAQVYSFPSPDQASVPWALLAPADDGVSELQAETKRIQVFRVYTKTQVGVGQQCTGRVPGSYHAQYWVYTPEMVPFAGFEYPLCIG